MLGPLLISGLYRLQEGAWSGPQRQIAIKTALDSGRIEIERYSIIKKE